MPLNIKDPATEKSVRELAALTGETVTTCPSRKSWTQFGHGDSRDRPALCGPSQSRHAAAGRNSRLRSTRPALL